MSKKRRRRRRVRRRSFKPFLAIIGILLGIALVSSSIKISKFLKRDPITMEACSSYEECNYSYKNAELGFLSELSIKLFYNISDNVNFMVPGSYQVIYDSRFPFMKDYAHTVNVVDTTPPVLELNPLQSCFFESIDDFVEPGYIVEDFCDGNNLKPTVEFIHSGPCWYKIQYTVSDKSGNTTTKFRKIQVVRGSVALTFDDGPSQNVTPQILDVLAKNNVSATFFIIGFNQQKESIVLREFNEGHTIGYHGTSHEYSKVYSSLEALMDNFYTLEDKVVNLTGYSSKIIRFPGGSSNTVSFNYCNGIMTAGAKEATENGYIYFDWNVDSGDAGSAKTAEQIYQNVVSAIRPGRLNVILMHDASGKTETLNALQNIIDFCFENDYELVKLDSNSKQVTHKIAN